MTDECSGQYYRSKLRGIEPALIQFRLTVSIQKWWISVQAKAAALLQPQA